MTKMINCNQTIFIIIQHKAVHLKNKWALHLLMSLWKYNKISKNIINKLKKIKTLLINYNAKENSLKSSVKNKKIKLIQLILIKFGHHTKIKFFMLNSRLLIFIKLSLLYKMNNNNLRIHICKLIKK